MRINKALLCITLITIFIMTGVTGCMPRTNSLRDIMITYLEEKYDDKFTYIDSFGGSMDGASNQILVSSKELPDKKISVGYYIYEDGEMFTDNYTHLKYKDQTESYFKEIFTKALGVDVIVSYGVSTTGAKNSFTSKTTFEDFLASPESKLLLTVMVSPDYDICGDSIDTDKVIKDAISSENLCCNVDMYFISDEDDYLPIEEVSIFALDDEKKLRFSTDDQGVFNSFEWVR